MFDIGFSELFVIAIVALLVLGPERLPRAARFAGLWARRARAQWYSVKSELESELVDEELKRSLLHSRDQLHEDLRQVRDRLQQDGEVIRRGFEGGALMTGPSRPLPAEDHAGVDVPADPDLAPPAPASDERR